jgi:peptidoglycan/LPS O-acetylase OafA/YrhL
MHDSRMLPALVRHPFNKFAADFSYTLYATHFPFIMFVIAASETLFGWGWHLSYTGGWELGLALLLVAASMVYAWLLFLAFESRTQQVYKWLKRGQQRLQDTLAQQTNQKNAAPGQVNEA